MMIEIGRHDALQPDLLSQASFDMSLDYLAEVEAERLQLERKYGCSKKAKDQQQSDTQFVQQSWDIGGGDDGVVRRKFPKSCASRRDASPEDILESLTLDQAPANSVDVATHDTIPTQKIAVKQDTMSFMVRMFPTGAEGTSSVRWTQLVQALTNAGMTAEQGAGSAVTFRNQSGSISFHKPHPEPVVDAIRLRGFGKRLHKWFGWSNETFVLRLKDGHEVQEDALK